MSLYSREDLVCKMVFTVMMIEFMSALSLQPAMLYLSKNINPNSLFKKISALTTESVTR